MGERNSCVLGIDLGTSGIKLVAVSRQGKVTASARESCKTISTVAGQAEQDCAQWLQALARAAKVIRARLAAGGRIEAIALTGQLPTLVVLDGPKPSAPAITWRDSRADHWACQRIDHRLRRDIYLKTGVLMDGRYLAPMFQYHYKSRKAGRVLSAKDFLFYSLTGRAVTDPSTASGYGLYDLRARRWDPELCEFWNIAAGQLPAIESSSFSAPLSRHGSQLLGCPAGTPVVQGCADSVAGAHALSGGQEPSRSVTVLTGSSTVILKCDPEPRWDSQGRFLVTPLAVDGAYGREADLLAGGSAREWAANLFLGGGKSKSQESLWRAAYRQAPGADGLLFAPFLAGGEQGVLWNPNLSGTITGLTLAHNGAKIARALLEGMCFEIRRCLSALEEEAPRTSLLVAGWMADVPEQAQLLADVTGQRLYAFALASASAVGTALLSGLIDGARYLANTRVRVFRPAQRSLRYRELYAKYAAQFPAGNAGSLPNS